MHKPGRLERSRRDLAAMGLFSALLPGVVGAAERTASTRSGFQRAPIVLAAASLKDAFESVAGIVTEKDAPRPVFSFAASSALARQIEAGAPAEVFVSADEQWMDDVERRGLLRPASRTDLLGNQLVLIAPRESRSGLKIEKGFPLSAALGSARLAVAGDAVPAGIYARTALERLGVFAAVEARLAKASDVRGALAFVARGEAALGIVYRTDALIEPRVRIVDVFPPFSHPPIVYPAALLSGAGPAAETFLRRLKSPEAQTVFRRYGFTIPV